jgi:hypothetical protein
LQIGSFHMSVVQVRIGAPWFRGTAYSKLSGKSRRVYGVNTPLWRPASPA